MKEKDIFELAEYFPGGSTNFEEPLNKALELLQESKFKGGTLCYHRRRVQRRRRLAQVLLRLKEKLKFKVYSVLIDLSDRESWGTLSHFSDKVTSVSQLTLKEARTIFLDL